MYSDICTPISYIYVYIYIQTAGLAFIKLETVSSTGNIMAVKSLGHA